VIVRYLGVDANGVDLFFTPDRGVWSWDGELSRLLSDPSGLVGIVGGERGDFVIIETNERWQDVGVDRLAEPLGAYAAPKVAAGHHEPDTGDARPAVRIIDEWLEQQRTSEESPHDRRTNDRRPQEAIAEPLDNVYFLPTGPRVSN
jgi:hypothetical protein